MPPHSSGWTVKKERLVALNNAGEIEWVDGIPWRKQRPAAGIGKKLCLLAGRSGNRGVGDAAPSGSQHYFPSPPLSAVLSLLRGDPIASMGVVASRAYYPLNLDFADDTKRIRDGERSLFDM